MFKLISFSASSRVSKDLFLLQSTNADWSEDGGYSGNIPDCKGVIAFGNSLQECQYELRSTLEEWILLGLKLGHHLPVIGNINLDKKLVYSSMGAL
jgi:predicted RNase H-like HicB family nuclease